MSFVRRASAQRAGVVPPAAADSATKLRGVVEQLPDTPDRVGEWRIDGHAVVVDAQTRIEERAVRAADGYWTQAAKGIVVHAPRPPIADEVGGVGLGRVAAGASRSACFRATSLRHRAHVRPRDRRAVVADAPRGRLRWTAMARALVPATFADYRELARRRLPRQLFDYIDGGSFQEVTLRDNAADLDRLRIRQQVLRDVSHIDLTTRVLGEPWSMPVAFAPVGLAGLMRKRGEVQAVRAAEAAGVPFSLSTVGLCSIEEVAAAARKPFWFQLYVMRDRGFVAEVIERAKRAGCSALVLTVDLAYTGARYRDVRNGLAGGLGARGKLAIALDGMRRLGWVRDVMLGGRPLVFGTIAPKLPHARSLHEFLGWVQGNFDPSVTWRDVEWIRGLWGGPLVIKGVLEPGDATLAAEAGAQAIVVSNHGGRQLDSVPSTIAALPAIVDAVGDRLEVLFDGGVRSGLDVVKAVALGARACFVGRAWVYALAAGGEAGVARMLATMRREMEVAMALAGVTSVAALDRSALV